jgi:hypothetical protein
MVKKDGRFYHLKTRQKLCPENDHLNSGLSGFKMVQNSPDAEWFRFVSFSSDETWFRQKKTVATDGQKLNKLCFDARKLDHEMNYPIARLMVITSVSGIVIESSILKLSATILFTSPNTVRIRYPDARYPENLDIWTLLSML